MVANSRTYQYQYQAGSAGEVAPLKILLNAHA
jgi:hypothetical protein